MFQFKENPNLTGYFEKGNWIPAQKEYDYEFDYGIQIQLNSEGAAIFQFKNRMGTFEPAEIQLVDADWEDGSWMHLKILDCSRNELKGKEITLKNPSREIVDGFHDGFENWEDRWSINKEGCIDSDSINQEFLIKWTAWFSNLAKIAFPKSNFPAEICAVEIMQSEFGPPFSGFIAFKSVIMRKKEVIKKADEFEYSIVLNEFEVKSFEEQFNIKLNEKSNYAFDNLHMKVQKGKRFISVEHSGSELKMTTNILKTKEELKKYFAANPVSKYCSVPNW